MFKKGASSSVANYRPISLTCIASKIMERILARNILHHLKDNTPLSAVQHGFRSTCTNLLESLNDWTLIIHNVHSVSHQNFFFCFDLYGIRGKLLVWLRRFFTERTHWVGASLSSFANLLSGVVQGSGIGPVAFLPRCMEWRRGLAMKILSVCSSVRPSVKCVDCDKTTEKSVQILYHTEDHLA